MDFDVMSSDESNILDLIRLLDGVGEFEYCLTNVEIGFYLAVMFYVDLFRVNIRRVESDLIDLNVTQQEYDVVFDEFNIKENERILMYDTMTNLMIVLYSVNRKINDFGEVSQSVYDEREKILSDYDKLNDSHRNLCAAIDACYNTRVDVELKLERALLKYEISLLLKKELILGWTLLKYLN
jgi:hypothetical protein